MQCNSTRSRRSHRSRRAFTLIEAIVVIVIIGVLAGIVAPRVFQYVVRSKVNTAKSSMASLRLAVDAAIIDLGREVQSGETLRSLIWDKPKDAPDSWQKGINKEADLNDPWGNPYILIVPGSIHVDYDIVSYGADGREGGDGDNADIVG
ncbi:MAG: type II secretion system major pseudopilin GspG [Phycisphaerales bacterium]|nr:type II secretion system major pseudopilin GspG [Phycisphaerales bacterium]